MNREIEERQLPICHIPVQQQDAGVEVATTRPLDVFIKHTFDV